MYVIIVLCLCFSLVIFFRIIRLEVEQETLSRRIREIVFNGDNLASTFDEENSRLLLWNRQVSVFNFEPYPFKKILI